MWNNIKMGFFIAIGATFGITAVKFACEKFVGLLEKFVAMLEADRKAAVEYAEKFTKEEAENA